MRYTPTTLEDIDELIANIRPEDAEEARLSGVPVTRELFADRIAGAISARSENSGRLYAVAGTFTITGLAGTSVIWGMSTRHAITSKRRFVRMSVEMAEMVTMQSASTRFINAMPAHYTGYIEWAKRHLSASFDGEFVSPTGTRFLTFTITKGG